MRLIDHYRAVRARTLALAAPLSVEDQLVQSMPDASPTKWHLAHSAWFFDTFVLASPTDPGLEPRYRSLFNSYYDAVGDKPDRARRGTMSRPSLDEVHDYRRRVDDAVVRQLEKGAWSDEQRATLELGIEHEQQHQELILTDIKHAFGTSPLRPAYHEHDRQDARRPTALDPVMIPPPRFRTFDEALVFIGHDGSGFAFDNELPRHRVFIDSFTLADRPVTCGEYLDFMHDGGYARPELWLSDGWQTREREGWRAPLYWFEREGSWATYTLAGARAVDVREPVMHVSYFEADAYARWAGARLPTEAEWERAAADIPISARAGDFADADVFHPGPARPGLFGAVWQWTQSPYAPYPGYCPPAGALGEYNGKFMCNQFVLRGGSCLSPAAHLRASYRNFFPAHARWQATGIRLARDA
jgi:ergothioneine biosynthesis protein EgtB